MLLHTSNTRSVATPEVFFGHATQRPPSGLEPCARTSGSAVPARRWRVTKNTIDVDAAACLGPHLHAVGQLAEGVVEAVGRATRTATRPPA